MTHRWRKRIVIMGMGLASFVADVHAQETREQRLLRWQDERGPVDSLAISLKDAAPAVRTAAARALANIQDSSSLPSLAQALRDGNPRVREAAAFAIGQIGSVSIEPQLLKALEREKNRDVQLAIGIAIGRTGSGAGLNALLARSALDARTLAHALVRFSLRGLGSADAVRRAFTLLDQSDRDIRWRALYALWRWSPNPSVESEMARSMDRLGSLAKDASADVRMNLATLLGRASSARSLELLLQMLREEHAQPSPDWRVEVSCARAAAARAAVEKQILGELLILLKNENPHIKIATMQALEQLPPALFKDTTNVPGYADRLYEMIRFGSPEPEPVRAEVYVLLGRMGLLDNVGAGEWLLQPEISPWMKSKILEAFSQMPSRRTFILLLQYLDHDSVRVATAAWDYLKRLYVPPFVRVVSQNQEFWEPVPPYIAERAVRMLSRNDMAVNTVISSFFGDTAVFRTFAAAGLDTIVRASLTAALTQTSSNVDVEAMQALIGALGQIGDSSTVAVIRPFMQDRDGTVAAEAARAVERLTGKPQVVKRMADRRSLHIDHDWELLKKISASPRVAIGTNRGRIILELLPSDAPLTSVSFARLASRGFYDGLLFHRVVPNFVVQGGDPRGDGWGGPGYSIRTEVSEREYERGSVGVASAGKDTEGCQFFVTHTAAPHLDGRYTIFARVVEGMDVVDRLQIGDTITSIRLGFN